MFHPIPSYSSIFQPIPANEGGTNESLGTDHGMSGPMRGLKTASDDTTAHNTQQHTDRHCDLETESAQWADSVKIGDHITIVFFLASFYVLVWQPLDV